MGFPGSQLRCFLLTGLAKSFFKSSLLCGCFPTKFGETRGLQVQHLHHDADTDGFNARFHCVLPAGRRWTPREPQPSVLQGRFETCPGRGCPRRRRRRRRDLPSQRRGGDAPRPRAAPGAGPEGDPAGRPRRETGSAPQRPRPRPCRPPFGSGPGRTRPAVGGGARRCAAPAAGAEPGPGAGGCALRGIGAGRRDATSGGGSPASLGSLPCRPARRAGGAVPAHARTEPPSPAQPSPATPREQPRCPSRSAPPGSAAPQPAASRRDCPGMQPR